MQVNNHYSKIHILVQTILYTINLMILLEMKVYPSHKQKTLWIQISMLITMIRNVKLPGKTTTVPLHQVTRFCYDLNQWNSNKIKKTHRPDHKLPTPWKMYFFVFKLTGKVRMNKSVTNHVYWLKWLNQWLRLNHLIICVSLLKSCFSQNN